MQTLPRLAHIVGHQLIPALTTLLFRSAVPSDGQRLIATIRKANKVLLQWFETEGISNFERLLLAIYILGSNKILAIDCRKVGSYAVMAKASIIEIAKYCLGTGFAHSPVVVRPLPLSKLIRMTVLAGIGANILRVGLNCSYKTAPYQQPFSGGDNGRKTQVDTIHKRAEIKRNLIANGTLK